MKQIDKLLHFCVCAVLMIVLAKWVFPFPLAIIAVCFVAFGKELYDRSKYGHFCWWDILADGMGLAVGTAIAILYTGVGNWGV